MIFIRVAEVTRCSKRTGNQRWLDRYSGPLCIWKLWSENVETVNSVLWRYLIILREQLRIPQWKELQRSKSSHKQRLQIVNVKPLRELSGFPSHYSRTTAVFLVWQASVPGALQRYVYVPVARRRILSHLPSNLSQHPKDWLVYYTMRSQFFCLHMTRDNRQDSERLPLIMPWSVSK